MVKLSQVEDESSFQEQPANASGAAPAKETQAEESDSESDSDFDDDFDENETIYERIVALKDIIPPNQRNSLSNFASSIKSGINASGSYLWIITSSVLLLGVPAILAIQAEAQMKEMEKQFTLQQSAQDVLAPGTENKDEKKV